MNCYNIAIIPARSGSKSILNKNIVNLHGHPLIAYSIAAAKLSKSVSRVIVSTDSVDYQNISLYYGAEVPFLRPLEFSSDQSTDKDFLIHSIQYFIENEKKVPEYLTHLRPTTPIREPSVIDKAVNQILMDKNSTSLRSAHKAPETPLKWFKKNKYNYFEGIIPRNDGIENFNLPKESFEQIYVPNGYVDVIKSDYIMNNNNIHGDKMIAFETNVCTEVDSVEELNYIDYQIQKNGSSLIKYLNNIKKV